MAAGSSVEWLKSVKAVILDMCGVLYDSGEGGGQAIPGSGEAVRRLMDSGLTVRFCTNETQNTRERFVQKLRVMGFDISVSHVFSPAPALIHILRERGLRPHLLVHDALFTMFYSVVVLYCLCVCVCVCQVVMIGDDLLNDVGGAQRCGMKGLQVRTGKYRPSDEQHPSVRADAYVDDLAAAVNAILTDH
uniref:Phospholysine phosphohistidine inorganic pyrophosphate phosphatase-like n=1 Tax=Sinocyclocheilus anshuiensis TaxID=1608454 RepID=A0A671LLN1_9TELE